MNEMPSFMMQRMQEMQASMQNMMLSACGGSADGISPLSTDGSFGSSSGGTGFFFGKPTSTVETAGHDTMPIRKKDEHGRSVKRRCVVCTKDTHSECSHPRCQARVKWHTNNKGTKVQLFGTPVCTLNCGVRDNHTDKCLIEHRLDFARLEASERGF